jgi:Cu(I)/Ag(I) efflux system periplasmic protein CusF
MKRFTLSLALAAFASLAAAQHEHHMQAATPAVQAAASEMSVGEVKSVDKAAGKITIKHGELKNVGMGPMTMVFGAKSPALLDKVAAGDKVKFRVEESRGDYVVTAIERAK